MSPSNSPTLASEALPEHASKPAAEQAAVLRRYEWTHQFGHMRIETCEDGSVWIDGKPVPETLPRPDDPPDRVGAGGP